MPRTRTTASGRPPGRIGAWVMPAGPGIRVDAGIEADTDLRPEYDPLLAKLMVHADDRPAAIHRLRRALDETLIGGLQTDAGFLRWLVDDAGLRRRRLRHLTHRASAGRTARR